MGKFFSFISKLLKTKNYLAHWPLLHVQVHIMGDFVHFCDYLNTESTVRWGGGGGVTSVYCIESKKDWTGQDIGGHRRT